MSNIQDIYPLGALQQGILFHHLLDQDSDTYLIKQQFVFDGQARLARFMAALQTLIARHDIFRTGIIRDDLDQPVQVVLRQVELPVERIMLDPAAGAIALQLDARYDVRRYRMAIDNAPLLHAVIAEDTANGSWVLHLLLHHLICDHTTLELMAEEIRLLLAGQAGQLPIPVPFRDFIAQTTRKTAPEQARAFFSTMLGHIDEPTAPYGINNVYGTGEEIDEVHQQLDISLAERLRKQARAAQVSATSLWHLAWGLVLARICGRDEVVFGTVLFGRLHGGARAEQIMGQCINTLPLCISTAMGSVAHGLRETHARLSGLLQHEHASLAEAQRCSSVAPSTPLFASLLNYRYSQSADSVFAARPLDGIEVLHFDERTNYPLTLTVDDLGSGFGLMVQGGKATRPAVVCGYLVEAITALLDALENAPDQALQQLDILPAAERLQLLSSWNATTAAVNPIATIHQLFEAQVARAPERVAVVFGDKQLSYGDLERRANQLAHALQAQGVAPGARIALCMTRSQQLLVALLGILKAGCSYVPLDPTYPSERLTHMLTDAAPALLLTQTGLLDVAAHAVPALRLDTIDLSRFPPTSVQTGVSGQHAAYMIYTSGSTGRPKGVVVEHAAVVNFLGSMAKAPGITTDDVMLALTTLSFDIAGLELYLPLTVGARIVLSTAEHNADADLLALTIAKYDVTIMQATPSGWRLLLDGGWQGKPDLKALCGGEALPVELAQRMLQRTGELWNLYGPTETTIWSTCQQVLSITGQGATGIGRPIDNTQIYMLDAHGRLAPTGVAGELHIAGAGVARGYWQRPELTAERFVLDVHAAEHGARMYRTGDLARWLPDGRIDYLGRIDQQVKIRGHRIELGEIETMLMTVDGVREAVVVARSDAADQRLVAYIAIHADSAQPDTATLRTLLLQQLPDYMVPAHFVVLAQLPLTPNGKVDRKALPAPQFAALQAHIAPLSETERVLAAIWAEVLGVPRVGVHDDFFALGGHSLLATQAMSKVRNRLQVELPLRTLFDAPTIAALAIRIDATNPRQVERIAAISRSDAMPLSHAQQRLWFLDHLAPGNALYHIAFGLRLLGNLHADWLRQAFDAVIARHEVLRTRFVLQQGKPWQRIDATTVLDWRALDLTSLPTPEREDAATHAMQQLAAQPFALGQAPLLRVALIQLSKHEHLLAICLHHIIADGWSLSLLQTELASAYSACAHDRSPVLPALPIQYADFAHWQRQWLSGDVLARQL
ncbi:amino acid adenylation domain-containing protein, partial [Andreprevotia lacus]